MEVLILGVILQYMVSASLIFFYRVCSVKAAASLLWSLLLVPVALFPTQIYLFKASTCSENGGPNVTSMDRFHFQ